MKTVFIIILAIALPFAWIAATPRSRDNHRAIQTTNIQLTKTKRAIEIFRKQYNRLPNNIAEIRVFAKTLWENYSPYDGFGTRLHYIPLTESHYFIKSFGADSVEDTLSSAEDPSLLFLPKATKNPPMYQEPTESAMRLYPAMLLTGSKSKHSNFYARIFVDPLKNTRHLVVRNLNRERHIMMATHPGIEEFLWLPNGYEIIYTATGSSRYQDGIYLWNIFTNKTRNLLSDMNDKYTMMAGAENRYHLSLSAIREMGKHVYAFIHINDGNPLDPSIFYSTKCLFKIIFPPSSKGTFSFEYPVDISQQTLFTIQPQPGQDIEWPFSGTKSQILWSQLPITGELGEILEKWQNFSIEYPKSPMFPYSLWWLGSIYGEAYRTLQKTRQKDADTLRAYGIELSKALSHISTAPTYLRAMGDHIYQNLLSSRNLNYSIIEFEAPSKNSLQKIWQ